MRLRLLLLSTDDLFREAARLEAQAFQVELEAAPSAQFAESLYAPTPQEPPHAVLIDLHDGDRETAVRWAHGAFPSSRVVLLNPHQDESRFTSAYSAAQRTPASSGGEIELFVERDRAGMQQVLHRLTGGAHAARGEGAELETMGVARLDDLVGRSIRFQEALEMAMKAATDPASPVLLTGEVGTGKRLFARAIHTECIGADGPFIRFDCRAMNGRELDALLSDEGPLRRAGGNRGGVQAKQTWATLFLEEISALDVTRQKGVLTFLDAAARTRALRQKPERPALKIIAATATNPDQARPGQTIHPDLLAKFSPYRIDLPPLRERPSDILLLAERFMSFRRQASGGPPPRLSSDVQRQLLSNHWPGNVRELFGVLEAALDEAQDAMEIKMDHLPDWILEQEQEKQPTAASVQGAPGAVTPSTQKPKVRIAQNHGDVIVELPEEGIAFETIERAVLCTALSMAGNNVVRAARLLKLGRGSLRYRLEKYGLVEPKRRRSAKRRPVTLSPEEGDPGLRRAS